MDREKGAPLGAGHRINVAVRSRRWVLVGVGGLLVSGCAGAVPLVPPVGGALDPVPAPVPVAVRPTIGGFAAPGRARVLLTYDDGPHPQCTPRVLDALAAYGITATFFVVGQNVVRYPHLVRRIVEAGHAVGNHSYTHPAFTAISPQSRLAELQRTQNVVAQAAGVVPVLFRPPYGATSAAVRAQVESLGLRQVLWDVDTHDYQNPGPRVVADRVLAAPSGRVVLLHDIHAGTAEATELFAPRLVG